MTACPSTVSIAIPPDEGEVFSLLCQLHSENGMFDMDEEKVRYFLRRALNQDGGAIGVVRSNGKIVGCIILFADSFWYTTQNYISEFLNYVHPDHRKSNHAKDLVDFAKWFAEQMDLPLMMGIMSTIRTRAKMYLLSKKMNFIGGLFIWNAPQKAVFEKFAFIVRDEQDIPGIEEYIDKARKRTARKIHEASQKRKWNY